MERKEYEMTQSDLDELLAACRPPPPIGDPELEKQVRAENAVVGWAKLAAKMGFDHTTYKSLAVKGPRFFTAVPIVPVAPTTAAVDVEMVRVPNSEVARLIAVAAVLADKWPDSVRGMVNHLSPAMLGGRIPFAEWSTTSHP